MVAVRKSKNQQVDSKYRPDCSHVVNVSPGDNDTLPRDLSTVATLSPWMFTTFHHGSRPSRTRSAHSSSGFPARPSSFATCDPAIKMIRSDRRSNSSSSCSSFAISWRRNTRHRIRATSNCPTRSGWLAAPPLYSLAVRASMLNSAYRRSMSWSTNGRLSRYCHRSPRPTWPRPRSGQ